MKLITKSMLASLALVVISSCYTHTFAVGQGADTLRPPDQKIWVSHWFFGLIGEDEPMNLSNLCPSGNMVVRDTHTFVNMLIGSLIGVVWTPTTVAIWCGEGTHAEIEVTPAHLRAAVLADPEAFMAMVRVYAPERVSECEGALYAAMHPLLDAPATMAASPGMHAAAGR